MWIKVKRNSVFVNTDAVAMVRGIGKNGSRGSVIEFTSGRILRTGYPATQLASILGLSSYTYPS